MRSLLALTIGALLGGALAGAEKPALLLPAGIALDAEGRVYVSDIGAHRIFRIDRKGGLTVIAGTGASGFSGDGGPAAAAQIFAPNDLAFDSSGTLYFADTYNHRIRKIDRRGVIGTVAGTGKDGYTGDGGPALQASLNSPQGISMDPQGNLLIADTYNHVIRRVDAKGIIETIAGAKHPGYGGDGGPALEAPLNLPTAVKAGKDGFLYISDSANSRVRRIDAAGKIATLLGFGPAKESYGAGFSGDGGPPEKAQIFTASDIAFDASGTLYVSDTGNNRIRAVAGGIVKTVAGTGKPGFGGDGGPALQARLHAPLKLAVDRDGSIVFADRVNHRVRKIDPAGVIRTLAGGGTPAGILVTSKQ